MNVESGLGLGQPGLGLKDRECVCHVPGSAFIGCDRILVSILASPGAVSSVGAQRMTVRSALSCIACDAKSLGMQLKPAA